MSYLLLVQESRRISRNTGHVAPANVTEKSERLASVEEVADRLCTLMREAGSRFSGMEEFNAPCMDCPGCASGQACVTDELRVCHNWIVTALNNHEKIGTLCMYPSEGHMMDVEIWEQV